MNPDSVFLEILHRLQLLRTASNHYIRLTLRWWFRLWRQKREPLVSRQRVNGKPPPHLQTNRGKLIYRGLCVCCALNTTAGQSVLCPFEPSQGNMGRVSMDKHVLIFA